MNNPITKPAPAEPNNTTSQIIWLSDGRTLGYAQYGTPTGTPVFYFHGTPSSRLEPLLGMSQVATRLGVRLIAPDRPGFGLSTFQPGRSFADWPYDILELANRLEIEKFAVVGYSGGGGFAIACGATPTFNRRLTALGVVSGVGPLFIPKAMQGMEASGLYFGSAKIHPWLTRLVLTMSAKAPRDKAPSQKQMKMPDIDYRFFAQPGFWAKFMEYTFSEAMGQGTKGPAYEARMYFKPWGFRFEDVTAAVQMWHGDQDQNAPISHARYMASHIPGCQLNVLQGEGHTFIMRRFHEVLGTLVASDERIPSPSDKAVSLA